MKLITAVIRPDRLPDVKTALFRAGVTGITISARQPSFCAESATPCAWFPAEAAITPRFSAALGRADILLYAPRSLNEKTGCMSSRLSSSRFPLRLERPGAKSSGLSTATS